MRQTLGLGHLQQHLNRRTPPNSSSAAVAVGADKREIEAGDCLSSCLMEHLNFPNNLNVSKSSMENSGETKVRGVTGCDEKRTAVEAEIARVNRLPSNSSYAVHRMRVLNKLLNLLTIQRSVSQDEELELLFASLSL
ncbi:hypothetical protein Cni_G21742 [Canna indica]|uniref:Uncharacterized protein n=1 Tax=Canna indica TaxID=4628 RepID=A0AAQ3QKK8_9LILI|nr:hypothetical protein Cni_G21742 [Canna indica]